MAAILAFGAHPDDIEFGCGGTVRKLIEKGWSAVHVCVTSGEAGSSTIDRTTLAATREQEARRAAEVLGAERVHFLRAPARAAVAGGKVAVAEGRPGDGTIRARLESAPSPL